MRCKVCTRAISPEHLQLQPRTMCRTPGASERLDYVLAADLFQTPSSPAGSSASTHPYD